VSENGLSFHILLELQIYEQNNIGDIFSGFFGGWRKKK
jgi:hypothetical protein